MAACSPSLDWRVVHLEQTDRLEAMFPCKPRTTERTLRIPGLEGGPVAMRMASCEAGPATWAVASFNAGDAARVPQALQALADSLRSNLREAGRLSAPGRPPPEPQAQDLGPVQVKGMTPQPLARHWRLEGLHPVEGHDPARVEVHAWHFSHGVQVVQATVWRPPAPQSEASWQESLATFEQGFKFPD